MPSLERSMASTFPLTKRDWFMLVFRGKGHWQTMDFLYPWELGITVFKYKQKATRLTERNGSSIQLNRKSWVTHSVQVRLAVDTGLPSQTLKIREAVDQWLVLHCPICPQQSGWGYQGSMQEVSPKVGEEWRWIKYKLGVQKIRITFPLLMLGVPHW